MFFATNFTFNINFRCNCLINGFHFSFGNDWFLNILQTVLSVFQYGIILLSSKKYIFLKHIHKYVYLGRLFPETADPINKTENNIIS